jgi:outer membrane protein OmpA-like peptidoglycan-associated protein
VKGFILFARYCLCFFCAIPSPAEAQEASSYPDYVVIGAFAKHMNAVKFVSDANQSNFQAKFDINPNRKLYYVYVLTTNDHATALEQALKLRTETKYFDTWVYSGPLGDLPSGGEALQSGDVNPATGEKIDIVRSEEERLASTASDDPRSQAQQRTSTSPLKQEILPRADASTPEGNDKKTDDPPDLNKGEAAPGTGKALPVRANAEPLTAEEIVGKDFFFSLFRADNHRVVEGEVDVVDVEKSRKMATYAANVPVKVMLPAGKSKQMSFVCQVFGYRKVQSEFDPAKPSDELYLDESGSLVVPFELVRLQKGDIAVMYNVFFFKDAAVMRPESRYEVNNLLALLVENPGIRIRIHGHTNGNSSGKIIRMGKPGNFYSLSESKDGFGTAKKLSEERALIIREYLVSSGITPDRMEVKAWGGKKPLFDKNSARAAENVRVEVEILSD